MQVISIKWRKLSSYRGIKNSNGLLCFWWEELKINGRHASNRSVSPVNCQMNCSDAITPWPLNMFMTKRILLYVCKYDNAHCDSDRKTKTNADHIKLLRRKISDNENLTVKNCRRRNALSWLLCVFVVIWLVCLFVFHCSSHRLVCVDWILWIRTPNPIVNICRGKCSSIPNSSPHACLIYWSVWTVQNK